MPDPETNLSPEGAEVSSVAPKNEIVPEASDIWTASGPDPSPGDAGPGAANSVTGPERGGVPIEAREPSGLALLALGAGGVLALRRRRKGP
jgi:hypothetical protein